MRGQRKSAKRETYTYNGKHTPIIYSNAKLFGERQRDALFDTHRQSPALRFRDYRQHFYHNAEKLAGDLTFCKNILTFAPNISVLCT